MTTPEDVKVAAARVRAEAARNRFLGSAHELQARVRPSALADQAKTAVIDKGEAIAGSATDFAKRKPMVAGGIATAALAFIIRKPIMRLFRRKPAKLPAEAKHSSATGDRS